MWLTLLDESKESERAKALFQTSRLLQGFVVGFALISVIAVVLLLTRNALAISAIATMLMVGAVLAGVEWHHNLRNSAVNRLINIGLMVVVFYLLRPGS